MCVRERKERTRERERAPANECKRVSKIVCEREREKLRKEGENDSEISAKV